MMPTTTVARRLPPSGQSPTQPSELSPSFSIGEGTERYSSERRADDFQPHDCESANLSGAEEKRTRAVPSADAHEMEKYALVTRRGSR